MHKRIANAFAAIIKGRQIRKRRKKKKKNNKYNHKYARAYPYIEDIRFEFLFSFTKNVTVEIRTNMQ